MYQTQFGSHWPNLNENENWWIDRLIVISFNPKCNCLDVFSSNLLKIMNFFKFTINGTSTSTSSFKGQADDDNDGIEKM